MEGFTFPEVAALHSKPRNHWISPCSVPGLAILVLVSLPFLIACFLLHHKQSPKTCWFHGASPVSSQAAIRWEWTRNCTGSVKNTDETSLEILESGLYFAYIYVASLEDFSTEDYFTVQLVSSSDRVLALLKGPSIARAFVHMGRPYFLDNGMKLHLEINGGLTYIDTNQTYWGLLKL